LKALGVGSAKRLAVLPDVPTIAERGFAGWNLCACGNAEGDHQSPRDEVALVVALPDVGERFSLQVSIRSAARSSARPTQLMPVYFEK